MAATMPRNSGSRCYTSMTTATSEYQTQIRFASRFKSWVISCAQTRRLEARDVAVFESGGFRNGIHRNSRRVGGGGGKSGGSATGLLGQRLF
jgi:hypothetical protein